MNSVKNTRPVWVDINLDHLSHNMREVKRSVKIGTLVSAVIKADGYGHGAVHIAKTLLESGADRLAVATLSEAIQLRRAYPDVEIMILGYTPNELAESVVKNNIIQTVYDFTQAEYFNTVAKQMNRTLKVHVKIDTGMRRIGMPIHPETVEQIVSISNFSNIFLEGVFTHFATADETDKTFTRTQVKRFLSITDEVEAKGIKINIKHVSNSAAIIDCPEYNFDMVRAGIMIYGLYPSKDVNHTDILLKEAMSLKVQIAQVKNVCKGEGVSYGLSYKAPQETQIITLPIGYADGFLRGLTFKAKGIVQNEIKPIMGRICMDQCMMEANGLNVKVGDTVTLFGKSEDKTISIDEYADMLNTINYEIVCMISKRVPRQYIKNQEVIHFEDVNLNQKLTSLW